MTIVNINSKWRVDIDHLNHTLEHWDEGGELITNGKHRGQLTKPSWGFVGYYPNMLQCIRSAVRYDATVLPETDLKGYIERLEKLNEEISNV